jgi:multiple sugar transport system permease protein
MTTTAARAHRPAAAAAGESPAVVAYSRVSTTGAAANLALAVLGLAFLLPLLWMLFAAFDSNSDWSVKLPTLTVANFAAVLTPQSLRSFYNSLFLAGATTVITTTLALLAAYPLSRRSVPLRRPLMLSILFATGLPVSMLLVPVYQMYVTLGWLDSLLTTSLFLSASSLPFAIWLLKNFIDAVPVEMEEAASMEGAGALETIARVVLPLTAPGIAVTAIYTFINAWGAFVVPLVLNGNPDDQPGPITIFHFLGSHGVFKTGELAAYSMLFSLPVVVLYLVMSRHFSGAFNFGGGVRG